jgi:uncharacterized protein YbjT (DUF2867 family)
MDESTSRSNEATKARPTTLLVGATGLVGSATLRELLQADQMVTTLARRPVTQLGPGHQTQVVDFEQLEQVDLNQPVSRAVSALGTTLKQAGSRAAFRRVDYDYVLASARLAKRLGARQFVLVSSMGADAASRNFYCRVKGEVETALGQLGFTALVILRPSLLLGSRPELRVGERLGQTLGRAIGPAFLGRLSRYRPVEAAVVARAIGRVTEQAIFQEGRHLLESDAIARLGAMIQA